MPTLQKSFNNTSFTVEFFQRIIVAITAQSDAASRRSWPDDEPIHREFLKVPTVVTADHTWTLDTDSEFLEALASGYQSYSFAGTQSLFPGVDISVSGWQSGARVAVRCETADESLTWMEMFEVEARSNAMVPAMPIKPTVFIGHGGNAQWHQLNTFLTSRGFQTVFYESGPRANRTIKEIVREMGYNSQFAVIVATAEDDTIDGKKRARQNVIHEMGYFHGIVGFDRTAVLLESGVETPSNFDGFQYIPFRPGHIDDSYQPLLEAIARESALQMP